MGERRPGADGEVSYYQAINSSKGTPKSNGCCYSTGFIAFTVLIFFRLGANLYVNFLNLKPEQFDSFPFRIS